MIEYESLVYELIIQAAPKIKGKGVWTAAILIPISDLMFSYIWPTDRPTRMAERKTPEGTAEPYVKIEKKNQKQPNVTIVRLVSVY